MACSTPPTTTGAKSRSSSSRCISASTKMLLHAVIIALIASLVLSVDAIRCHECNSHTDEDCISLRLNTPRAPVDNQYLTECVTDNKTTSIPFCRKSVVKIDVTGEQRIVRSCGKIAEPNAAKSKLSCFNADNEGFAQVICACYEDGCNAAPASVSINQAIGMVLVCGGMLLGAWLRRSG